MKIRRFPVLESPALFGVPIKSKSPHFFGKYANMNHHRWLPETLCTFVLLFALLGISAQSVAQVPGMPPQKRKYTPVDAAFDSYYASEAERLGQIDAQLGLNNQMRLTGWYGSYLPSVFEPWPMIPGRIWGYPILQPVRQSIGQRSYQVGSNRWISEPVYADQLAPPAGAPTPYCPVGPPARNGAPGAAVELPGPRPEPDDVPAAGVPTGPAVPPAAGPREF